MSDVTELMAPALGRVRAYFAPVNRAAQEPTLFDPAQNGAFDLDTPPSPWIDLGWIAGFARHSGTKVEALQTGAPAATQFQVRSAIEASVSFSFESWGKLQLSLASGSQQMNLLKTAAGTAAAGSGGTSVAATVLASGSTANALQVGATAAANFAVGETLAVDVDCAGQTGFVGSGVSGAYLRSEVSDVDYVRRVTLNVGRIAAITGGVLTLESALLAGAPVAGMKFSVVSGFCDREGSSFFQEWSGLFVGEGQQGERVIWHYPRLQTTGSAGETMTALTGGYEKARLSGSFRALAVRDSIDGETVVCFRSYMP